MRRTDSTVPDEETFARAERILSWALGLAASLVLLSWVVVATAHANDRFNIGHVSGAWMALARYAEHGVLYPPLYSHGYFGGTRYMPLQIVLDGGASHLLGDELLAGKLVSYGLMLALLGVLFVSLRRLGCSLPFALGASALLLTTQTGLLAATSIYGDLLPLVLQLSALLVISSRPSSSRAAIAGALCALAFLSKLSAVWAAIAIAIWLVLRSRRLALVFVGITAVIAAAGVAVFEALSHGRMLDNVGALSTSGLFGLSALLLRSPKRMVELSETYASSVWTLMALAVIPVVVSIRRRALSLYQLSLGAAIVVLIVVLNDQGTDYNHLLDLEVLTLLVVGELWALASSTKAPSMLRVTLAALVLWLLASGYVVTMAPVTRDAASKLVRGSSAPGLSRNPVQGYVEPGETLLSEDPTVPVLLDEQPTVLDAFMLLRIGQQHPSWQADLIRRLDRRAFAKVVLMRELDLADSWWRTHHFGLPVARAIARNYRLLGAIDSGYWIYVPRASRV
jgi:hypothetical protein